MNELNEAIGFTRTVVRYTDKNGNNHREVVKYSNPEVIDSKLLGTEVIVFESQHDSTIHVIQKSLVLEVFQEKENPKYGTFHRVKAATSPAP